MASKQNDDLFNQASKQNEGSLPLDFAGEGGKKAETVKKETSHSASAPIPHAAQYSPDVEKSDLNSVQRKPMHHIPPSYKKSVQEQSQTQEVKETKPTVPVSSPVAAVRPPVEEKIPEPPKPTAAVKQEVKTPAPDPTPAVVHSPEPKPVQVPITAASSPVSASAPVATAAVSVQETVPAPAPKSEPAQERKEPVKLQPKSKEPKEEKKSEHKVEHKVEKTHSSHVPHKKEPPPVQQTPAPSPVRPAVHEVNPVKQDEKKEILKSKKFNIIEKFSSDNATSGQILQEGRVRMGMSIDQISITTKIKNNFIEALERDDYQNLPAPVYVNAYVRSLCYLYKIDEHHVLSLLNKAKGKALEYTVPEEVIHHIEKGKQINIVQEIKVKRIAIMIIAACLILLAVTVVVYQLLIMNKPQISRETPIKNEKAAAVNPKTPAYDSVSMQDQMEKKLVSPHVFTMSQLPLPEQH